MRILKCILCLILLVACSQQEGKFITNLSVEAVRDEHLSIVEDAKSISRTEEKAEIPGQTIISTTYTTSHSVDSIKDYYRKVMQDYGWEPHFIGAVAQDIQAGDLIFGKAGQDGGYPGDSIIFRHVSLSVHTCNQGTCVIITDMSYLTTLPENFN
jgi:hypothetical protein